MLYILEEKGVRPKIINGTVEKSLNFFLPQIDCDYVIEAGLGHQGGDQLANYASSGPHLAWRPAKFLAKKKERRKKENIFNFP